MKANEVKNTGHYRIANISAIVMIVFFGVNTITDNMRQTVKSNENLIMFSVVVALALLIPVIQIDQKFCQTGVFYSLYFIFI